MKLPALLQSEFERLRGGAPLISARAIYDLEGNLGTTHLAADEQGLVLFSQPVNQQGERRQLNWADILEVRLRNETLFSFLHLDTHTGSLELQFTGWDATPLQRLIDLWQKHQIPPGTAITPPMEISVPASTALPAPLPQLDPLTAFCACVHAMIECDEEIEPAELRFLSQRLPEGQSIQEGQAFLKQHGLDTLCACLPKILKQDQRRCLMANLIGVAMVDGCLRSRELELLDRFQTALGIAAPDRQTLFDTLMAKNNLAVFASPLEVSSLPEADGLTPLMAYCAALLAMMEADRSVLDDETMLLKLTVPYPEDVLLARDYLHGYGLDHLLSRLGSVLNPDQQRCLLANVIAVAMVDGVIRSAEQELLDRFQNALGLCRETFALIYATLLLKNNLSVFANPP